MFHIKVYLLLFINICNLCKLLCFNPCSDKYELVTDLLTSSDCGEGFFYVNNGNPVYNCFPRCFPKYDITTTPCSATNPCPQGYTCPTKINEEYTYCKIDEESCFKYHIENIPWNRAWWKPECLPNGKWASKQCKGEQTNGRCFCYDANGNRIFGEALVQDSEDMTCACSRQKSDQSNKELYPKMHCDSKGNYELLQCDNGHCSCVDPRTGKITSKIVSEGMMTLLPCYDKATIGEKYLRQCESKKYAQEQILRELKIHGTDHSNIVPILCDDDGTYGPYKIENGIIYCTWKDNSPIDNFINSVDQKQGLVNCNCARDTKLYQLRGQKQSLVCSPNGNYRPEQEVNGQWYCVDQDGFRKSDFFETMPDNCDEYI